MNQNRKPEYSIYTSMKNKSMRQSEYRALGDRSVYPKRAGVPTSTNNESGEGFKLGASIQSAMKPPAPPSKGSMVVNSPGAEVPSEYPLALVGQESESELRPREELTGSIKQGSIKQ